MRATLIITAGLIIVMSMNFSARADRLEGFAAPAKKGRLSVTTSYDSGELSVEVKLTQIEDGKKFKDFHIPEPKGDLPGLDGLVDLAGGNGATDIEVSIGTQDDQKQTWKVKKDKSGIHVYANGAAGFSTGGSTTTTVKFKIKVNTGPGTFKLKKGGWVGTNNGGSSIPTGHDGPSIIDRQGLIRENEPEQEPSILVPFKKS